VEELGKKFTEQTNVPVVVQELGFGDIRDQLKVAGPAGQGPDIIVGAHDWIGELITNGLLEPIDLGDKANNVDPLAIKAFTYQGKLYALPYGLEGIALIYNTELVPTPPKDWAELKQIAKRLQDEKKVDQGYVLQQGDPYHTFPFWTGHGSHVFGRDAQGNYDPKQLLLDNEGGQAAMKELDSMVKEGLLRKDITYDIMTTLFKEGKSAMWFGGPWVLSDLRKSPVADKFGITKIPPMQTESRPFIGSQGFMVNAFAKNKDLAKAFLTDYLATDEAMEIMYKNDPRIPAWKPQRDKVAASSTPEDQQINAFAEAIANGDPMPAIPEMSAVWEAWGKAITLVFQQQEDPVKAIKDAGEAIRAKLSGTSY
jgi:maltose/maltodextrin transport system substrate-binding protein/arabinogalactan oligomer/maltooligosaccharide transport system substrate-binding protein